MQGVTRHSYAGHRYVRIEYRAHPWARQFVPTSEWDSDILPRSNHVLLRESTRYMRDEQGEYVRGVSQGNLSEAIVGSTYAQALNLLGVTHEQLREALGYRQDYHSRAPLSNRHRDTLARGAAARGLSAARIRDLVNSGLTPEAGNHSEVGMPEYSRPAARAAHLAFLAGGQ